MSTLILPRRFDRQPNVLAKPGSILLRASDIFLPSVNPMQSIHGRHTALTKANNPAAITRSNYGGVYIPNAVGPARGYYGRAYPEIGSGDFTIVTVLSLQSGSTSYQTLGGYNGTTGIRFYLKVGGLGPSIASGGSWLVQASSAFTPSYDSYHTCVFGRSSGILYVIVDGVLCCSVASTADFGPAPVALGGYINGTTIVTEGWQRYQLLSISTSGRSIGEMQAASLGGWQRLFVRRPKLVFSAPSGGGAAAQTLAALSSSASGVLRVTGGVTQTLADVVSSVYGTLGLTGALSQTMEDVSAAASGAQAVTGALAQALGDISASASGTLTLAGTLSQALDNVSGSEQGTLALAGVVSATLEGVALTASGQVAQAGTGSTAQELAGVAVVAAGTLGLAGQVGAALAQVTLASAGKLALAGTLTQPLPDISASASGTLGITGTLTQVMDGVVLAASCVLGSDYAGSTSAQLEGIILGSSATLRISAQAVVQLGPVVLSASGLNPGASTITTPGSRSLRIANERRASNVPSPGRVIKMPSRDAIVTP